MPWPETLSPKRLLARFFGSGAPARHGDGQPTAGQRAADAARPARPRPDAAGRLDLASLRADLGERWEALAPSLHRMTGRFLSIRLDGRGSFAREGDTYVIGMPGLPRERVQAACDALLKELTELIYSGRSFEDHLQAAGATAPAGAGSMAPGRLRRLLQWMAQSARRLRRGRHPADAPQPSGAPVVASTAGVAGDAPGAAPPGPVVTAPPDPQIAAAPAPPPSPPVAAFRAGAARSASALGQDLTPATSAAAVPTGHSPAARQASARPPPRESAFARRLREARALESGVFTATLRRADDDQATDDNTFPPPTLHFRYQPVWNVRNKMLATYVCLAASRRASGAMALGDGVLPTPRTAEDVLLLDVLNLEQAVRDLRERQAAGRGVATLVSTHLATLTDPEQWPYFAEAIGAVEDDIRRRLLIEINGLGDLRNQPRAFEVLRRVAPLCRGIIARTGLHENSLTFWKNCRVIAVGPHVGDDMRPEARIIADLNRFALLAEHAGLPSFVRGLRSRSLAVAAIAAGFNYIAGPVMGTRFNDSVGVVRRFELSDLYAEEAEDLPAA